MSDKEAAFKLTVVRSEALRNFHVALRQSGVPAVEACELVGEHAKYLDAAYEADLSVIRECMERKS
jgi:hypothetical protein